MCSQGSAEGPGLPEKPGVACVLSVLVMTSADIPQLSDLSNGLYPPVELEAHPQVPADQPVGFVCREDWVDPVHQQLDNSRLH